MPAGHLLLHKFRSFFPVSGRPGASEEALDDAERQLGTRLCPALRVLYRVHDGQELEFDRQVGAASLFDLWRCCRVGV